MTSLICVLQLLTPEGEFPVVFRWNDGKKSVSDLRCEDKIWI